MVERDFDFLQVAHNKLGKSSHSGVYAKVTIFCLSFLFTI